MLNIFVADSTGLLLLVFMQQFSKSKQMNSRHRPTCAKQNLTQNGHSRSFMVTHFVANGKLTRDYISWYNNFGLVSEKRTGRQHWKLPFSTTPLSFDALLQGTPAKICINLILPETRVTGLHFLPRCYVYLQARAIRRSRSAVESQFRSLPS